MVEGLGADEMRLERVKDVHAAPVDELLAEIPDHREVAPHAFRRKHVRDVPDRIRTPWLDEILRVEEEGDLRLRLGRGQKRRERRFPEDDHRNQNSLHQTSFIPSLGAEHTKRRTPSSASGLV